MFNSPESHISVAWRLKKEIPHAVILDQVYTLQLLHLIILVLPY